MSMKKKVVKGCVYSVTAKEDTTITDDAGLNLTVKAGTQETFTAASSEVDLSKEAELVLIKGNFSPASTATSGGGGGSDSPRAEKLAEYLYEMHVDAIDYDFAEKYFQDHDYPAESGACSAVKAGNIFGRNFDWTYNRDDTYVVRIRPTATRSASISVAARVTKDTDSRIIPFLAKDGINEAGLCVSINVVPHGDKGDNSTVVTAGSEKTLCTVMVPRYILDHFTTAAAAAQAMQTFSYYHPASTIASGYEHHFLIADKDNAYILEFVEGAVVVTEVNGAPFMTNFHVDGTTLNADNSVYTPATQTETETAFSYNHITKHGAGLERWNLLAAGVAGATDVEGMRTLMTSLKYTNTYRVETTPRWDTELVGIAELEVDSPTADFTPVHTAVQEQFSKRTRDDAPELQTWQTVHSSVYDMKALSLQLVVQEDASAKYSFALYKGGGEEIELDQIPTQGHVKQAVSSDGVYNSLQAKQDKLTAGTNITIENNVISAPGGEPFDGNLDADLHVGLQPKTKATGSVQILDSQAAGVLKIGDNPEISIPKWNGVQAYVDVTPAAEAYYYSDWRTQYMSITVPKVGSKPLTMFAWMKPSSSSEVRTPADLVDAINGKNSQGSWSGVRALAAELLPNGNIRLTNKRDNGAAGNVRLTVAATLFKGTSVTLANGDDSPRTVDAVLSQLNAGAASCLATSKTSYDESTGIVSLEALEYGINDTISVVSGDLFANPTGMSGGLSGRKIYLNEQVLDIGGPPNIVVPETALPADNKLQNGHIYLVTANSAEGTNLSSLELPAFAKADIWLEYVSGPVSWSPNWSWVDDMVPEGLAIGTRYFIEVFSDGVAEIAKLKYSYTHA